jgi:hypothetical protein
VLAAAAIEPNARYKAKKGSNRSMESANDIKKHEKTYGGFVGLLKWSVPLVAVIVLLVVILIA